MNNVWERSLQSLRMAFPEMEDLIYFASELEVRFWRRRRHGDLLPQVQQLLDDFVYAVRFIQSVM